MLGIMGPVDNPENFASQGWERMGALGPWRDQDRETDPNVAKDKQERKESLR